MTKKIGGVPKKKIRQKRLMIIGWREWLALPELGINIIKTKVDTGARTSALHAYDIKPYQKDGQEWVRFTLHPIQRNNQIEVFCNCPVQESRWITNSGGIKEQRFVITTPITLGKQTWDIEITLTNRDEMGFRMLLGRTALKDRILIDPEQSYFQGRPKISRKLKIRPKRISLGRKRRTK